MSSFVVVCPKCGRSLFHARFDVVNDFLFVVCVRCGASVRSGKDLVKQVKKFKADEDEEAEGQVSLLEEFKGCNTRLSRMVAEDVETQVFV